MAKESAGILLYRFHQGELECLLVHPGGPFWKNKDAGSWTIPKGEIKPGETALAAAQREFTEEVGFKLNQALQPLAPVRQKAGKIVHAWACQADCDPQLIRSNTFRCEWPPKSGKFQDFPEIDRAEWFTFPQATLKINSAQLPLLEQLQKILSNREA